MTNLEKKRQYNREYMRKWRREHPEEHRKDVKRWAKAHPKRRREIVRKSQKKRSWELRLKALTHYGGNPPKCVCCGESEIKFLTIDHIHNDGKKQRRIHGIGYYFYKWLEKNNYPKGFQVLCMNCNCAKAWYGKCPHE